MEPEVLGSAPSPEPSAPVASAIAPPPEPTPDAAAQETASSSEKPTALRLTVDDFIKATETSKWSRDEWKAFHDHSKGNPEYNAEFSSALNRARGEHQQQLAEEQRVETAYNLIAATLDATAKAGHLEEHLRAGTNLAVVNGVVTPVPPGTKESATVAEWIASLQRRQAPRPNDLPAETVQQMATAAVSRLKGLLAEHPEFKDVGPEKFESLLGDTADPASFIVALAAERTKSERKSIKDEIAAGINRWLVANNYSQAEPAKLPGDGTEANGVSRDRAILDRGGNPTEMAAAFKRLYGAEAMV